MAKYRVVPGDTLSDIGKRLGIPYQQITGYRSKNPDLIFPGEELDIPDQPQPVSQLNQQMTPVIQQRIEPQQSVMGNIGETILGKPAYASEAKPIEQLPQTGNDPLTSAFKAEGIDNPNVLAYAKATMEHETAGTNQPIDEYGGPEYWQRYEGRADLGNTQPGDGIKYHGRGYIQLTGRANYRDMGNRIGVDLENNPDLALRPDVAAKIMAAFFKDRGVADLASQGNFYAARGPVNGTDQANKIAMMAQRNLVL